MPPALVRRLWPEQAPDRVMRGVAVMLFAYVWRVQDVFPILGKLQLALAGAGVALALFAADRHPWRRLQQLRTPLLTLVGVLLALMLIGVPTSLVRGVSLTFIVKSYVPNVVLLILVAASVRSERDVEWYAKMNLYGAMMYALVVNLFFHVGSDGRLGDLIYYDANDFALIMVCTIPFAVFFLQRIGSARWRPLGVIGLLLLMIGLVKSGSRGGFLGLIAVMLYIILRYRALPSRVRLVASTVGIVLLIGFGSSKYWDMMGTILHPESDYNWSGDSGRREVWKRGIGYMLNNPIMGLGVRTFPTAEGRLSDESRIAAAHGRGFKWSVAHNSFVETGAEVGIPGLCVFLALFVVTFTALSRLSPRAARAPPWVSPRIAALAQMLIGSLVGFMVSGFFVSAEYFSYLYFIFGLALGLQKLVRLRRQAVIEAVSYRPAAVPSAAPGYAFPSVGQGNAG